MNVSQGQMLALFAFDVGYEVSLDRLRDLLASTPVHPLSQKKRTPTFLQYARPPHVLSLGPSESLFGEPGQVQATIFDFGAVSISFRYPFAPQAGGVALGHLPELGQQLYSRKLEAEARRHVQALVSRIAPAIVRPDLSPMTEDYYIFIIERLERALLSDELVREHGQTLAQALRLETANLSRDQQDEALSQKLSYYEDDLVLIDWNAALIYDQDYEDTVSVLELLNVELLEARYIDAQLDRRIEEYANLTPRRGEWPIPLRTPYRQAIQDLTELRVESALVAERVGNALKLIGDLYLARVHSAAAQRFYLHEWESIISHKLNIIEQFYNLLNDRLGAAQNQTLELAVIVLILVELVLAILARR